MGIRGAGYADSNARASGPAVVIIGAGVAGLTTAVLLERRGVSTIVLEHRSRERTLARARAGLVQYGVARLLAQHDLASGLTRDGLECGTAEFRFSAGAAYPAAAAAKQMFAYGALTGRPHTVYPQQLLVRDLVAAYESAGGCIVWGAANVALHNVTTEITGPYPQVVWHDADRTHTVACDWVVGADGQSGATRAHLLGAGNRKRSVSAPSRRNYGVAWLAVLAAVAPSASHTIYAVSPDGFAGHMLRSADVTRFYLEVPPGMLPDAWSAERIWATLERRLALGEQPLTTGPIIDRSILQLRGEILGHPRLGRLVLTGDAAHLIPPLGAQGANLALRDAFDLAPALSAALDGAGGLIDAYPNAIATRAEAAERWSARLSSLIHARAGGAQTGIELATLLDDPTATAELAEKYAGPPAIDADVNRRLAPASHV